MSDPSGETVLDGANKTPDLSEVRAPAAAQRRAARTPAAGGTVRIMIPRTERDVRDVPLGRNGDYILVKRGVPVDLPIEFLEVLDNAKETRYYEEIDPADGRKKLVPQVVHSYPYQRA